MKKKATPAERDFVDAASLGDMQGINDAMVEMRRDPTLWFCSGLDENGMPRVYGLGDTQDEAEANARLSADGYFAEKAEFRVRAPLSDWRFISYAPDPA
jgi:hypothetical protein